MRSLDDKLKNKKINYGKLLKYGFVKENECYIYKSRICDDKFEVIVKVLDSKMTSKLVDIENNDEYILVDIQDSVGEFVGNVRENYENELKKIIAECTEKDVFKNNQTKDVIKYVKEKYEDDLEFLWEKFDDNAIIRNKINNKWYVLILTVSERKLGIDSDNVIEIIDLRYQKDTIKSFVDNKKIFLGYHMNKNSWITIKLDNSVENEEIFELIDNSYNLSLNK